MSYERVGLLLEKPTQTAPDKDILDSLNRTLEGSSPAYKLLQLEGDTKERAASELHNGESPDMTSEHLDQIELSARLERLRDWKRELLARDDIDPDIKQAYRWKVNEEMAYVHMLRASQAGDMRSFQRWNEFIYGRPNEQIYKAALDWVAADADKLIAECGPDSPQGEAARAVLDAIGDNRGDKSILIPDEETFASVRDDHMREGGYYALLLTGVDVPSEGKVDRATGEPILKHVVRQNLRSDYDITLVTGPTWGVNHTDGTVEQPQKYSMAPERFVGLGLGHEIGSHLLERVNGERGPLQLVSKGLDRYELGNEGRAVVREQVVYETIDEFGGILRWRDILRRHIAISYACGAGERPQHSASEVYSFVNLIDYMYQIRNKPADPDEAAARATKRTDALVLRVLKGTDGTGGAFLKDKIYLEGNVAVWRVAKEQGPAAISNGDLGKFNVADPRHISLLQKLGLLPDTVGAATSLA